MILPYERLKRKLILLENAAKTRLARFKASRIGFLFFLSRWDGNERLNKGASRGTRLSPNLAMKEDANFESSFEKS